MKYIFAICLIISLISCRQPAVKSSTVATPISADTISISSSSLMGRIYHFGPTLNDTICSIESPCDCCASDILFSDEHHFIAIFWCLQDDTYAHGTYSIEGGQVYLQFEGKKVDYLSDMQVYYDSLAQHDSLQSINRYVVDTMPHNIDTLRGFICHDKLLFKSRSMDYGAADREIHNKPSGFIQDTILRMMELQ